MKKLLRLSMLPLGVLLSSDMLAQSACSVALTSTNSWGSGAQYNLNIKNTGNPISSWNVCFTFTGAEVIGDMWGGIAATKSGNVCVQNAPYNGALATNASADVGFIVQSPSAAIPTSFTLNGVSCNGAGSVSSVASSAVSSAISSAVSSSAISSAPVSSASSSSVASTPAAAAWVIDTDKSTFHFVPVKNVNTAEAMTFTEMSGTVTDSGAAVLQIPTTTILSGSTRRDGRMREHLFEVNYMPHLYFTHNLDLASINAMAAGDVLVKSLTGNLTLHAITRAITFDALIVKHADGSVSVSPRRPIVIDSNDFDLSAGVAALRVVANQSSIGVRAPVYFKIFLKRNLDNQVAAISVPGAPTAPTDLQGTVGAVSGDVSLVWSDTSNNETGFLVRRKDAEGRWARVDHVDANNVSFFESLLDKPGTYDYKVIAINEGVGSLASNAVTLTYTLPQTSSSSSETSTSAPSSSGTSTSAPSSSGTSQGSSTSAGPVVGSIERGAQLWDGMDCSGCHGKDGEKYEDGTFAMVSVNPNREIYRHSRDTEGRDLATFIEMWMPASNPGTCNAQCAADLEALIRSWRRPSDGIPDKPVSVFSCPSNASPYGQRTLRLLTRNEYQNSVRDILAYTPDVASRLPDDFIAGYFSNNNILNVDKNRYTSYLATAERIADDVATRWSSVLSCSPNATCAQTLVDNVGKRLFRRPLTTDERTAYLAVAQGTADNRTAAEGMKVALTAMLSSPQFLYRSEMGESIGNGAYKLTGYEIATYMSYAYTGTTPTLALMDAAGRGELDNVTGIRQHAATLLNSQSTRVLLDDVVNRWLGTEQLEIKEKNGVPDFATVAQAMKKELGKNFTHAMLDPSSTFATLYNPNYTHVNQRLASLYGLSFSGTPDADGFARVNSSGRGGILLTGAFFSRYATAADANMITRAVALRRRMMCQDIPEPPSGVSLDREALAARDREFFESPHTTQRMMFDRITSGTTCANCHGEIINQVGGGMENFDALGRHRAVDLKGNPINARGTFFSPFPQLQFLNDPDRVIHEPAITFDGGQDLARTIVEDPMVSGLAQSCLATQMLSYSSGIHSIFLVDSDRDVGYARISKAEEDAYRCSISGLQQTLVDQGPRAMLEAIPAMDSVLYRQEWAR